MELQERLEDYTKQLDQAKALFFRLQGAVESIQLLIDEEDKVVNKLEKKEK
tara:strand:- start:273 stop:425 length:153 start_codon:yes stop_codon:yes gene_type:complete